MPVPTFQLDAYRRTLETRVAAVTPSDDAAWLVELDDTILYAEGGGQPADHGAIAGVAVSDVQWTQAGRIRHRTAAPLEVGRQVKVELDWARRYDHMQQHTGQHLISALAADRFGLETVGFHLGETGCTVDLNGPLSADLATDLTRAVNAEIRAARPVRVQAVSQAAYADAAVRSRGLPEGHRGDVRLVEIDGLDLNTCGGTHVTNTAELQLVHFHRLERVRGGQRVHFLAGGRAIAALEQARDRAAALTALLRVGPDAHLDATARLHADASTSRKTLKSQSKELAGLLGAHLGRATDLDGVLTYHRKDADLGFLRMVAQAARAQHPDRVVLLTAGPDRGEGLFLLSGPEAFVSEVTDAVASALHARAGGARGTIQGKAARLEGREAAAAALRRALSPAG